MTFHNIYKFPVRVPAPVVTKQEGGGQNLKALEQQLAKLSDKEARELLLLTMYKLSMTRARLDAMTDLLVQKNLLDPERLWKLTSEKFTGPGF